MAQPRALLVGLHAYPDPAVGARRISELANHLARRGWQVKVVASDEPFSVRGGELHPEVERIGVPVPDTMYESFRFLVPQHWRGSGSQEPADSLPGADRPGVAETAPRSVVIERLRFEYLRISGVLDNRKRWGLRLLHRLSNLLRSWRPDIMLVSGPAWSPVVAVALRSRLHRIPYVLDLRDPWLGRGGHSGVLYAGPKRWLDVRLERHCVRQASAVTVASRRLSMQMSDRYPADAGKFQVIRNGFDGSAARLSAPPAGRLELLHAGTVYFNRNPMPLLEGFARLASRDGVDRQRLGLTLVGDCARFNDVDLAEWCSRHGLEGVARILPPVAPAEVRRFTESSHVLVTLAQGQPDQVPAKLFEQLGTGRDILLFAEPGTESATVASEAPWVRRVSDLAAEVDAALDELYRRHVLGEPTREEPVRDVQRFSREGGLQRFETLLEELIELDSAARSVGV